MQQDYKNLLTEVIKKQILILGPQIVVAKVRSVSGIQVDDNGVVLEVTGDPQKIIQDLINQFVSLSGEIVKKTMEPLLTYEIQDGVNKLTQSKIDNTVKPNATPVTPVTTTPAINEAVKPIINTELPTVQTVATPTPSDHPAQIDQQAQDIINSALKKPA